MQDQWETLIKELKKLNAKELRAVIITVVVENDEKVADEDPNVKILSFTAGNSSDLGQALLLTNAKVTYGIRQINEAESGETPHVRH